MPFETAPKVHTIAILGGTGFVGKHLACRLTLDNHRLRILTRRREQHRDLLVLPSLELVQADPYDSETLKRELAGCDVVINLVGILNERGHKGEGFYRAHVEFPRQVIETCRANGIRRLLHMSALGADADKGLSHYQRSKGQGERLVLQAEGLRVTTFRPSVIFGPDDSLLNRFARLLRLAPGILPLACAGATFAPIYVGDVVEAFARAIDDPRTFGQSYELCGPRVYTLRALVEYTARTVGVRRKVIGLGDTLSAVQANLLEWFPGKPFSRDNYLSMKRANVCSAPFPEVFGIAPTSLESVAPEFLR